MVVGVQGWLQNLMGILMAMPRGGGGLVNDYTGDACGGGSMDEEACDTCKGGGGGG